MSFLHRKQREHRKQTMLDDYFLEDLSKEIIRSFTGKVSSPRSHDKESDDFDLGEDQYELHQLASRTEGFADIPDGDLITVTNAEIIKYDGLVIPVRDNVGYVDGSRTNYVEFDDRIQLLTYYPLDYWIVSLDSTYSHMIDTDYFLISYTFNRRLVLQLLRRVSSHIRIAGIKYQIRLLPKEHLLVVELPIKTLLIKLPGPGDGTDINRLLEDFFIFKLAHDVSQAVGYSILGGSQGSSPELDSFNVDDYDVYTMEYAGVRHHLEKIDDVLIIPMLNIYDPYYFVEFLGMDHYIQLDMTALLRYNNILQQVLNNLKVSYNYDFVRRNNSSLIRLELKGGHGSLYETTYKYLNKEIQLFLKAETAKSAVARLLAPIWIVHHVSSR